MGFKNRQFIERSIMGALSFFKESLFCEEYASRRGFLQARDPRVKFIIILALLSSVLFANNIPVIGCIYALCLILAAASSINIIFFLTRGWLFIPLFSLYIAIPALFNTFTQGEAWVSFRIFSLPLSITKQGIASAGIFFLRVLTSVSLCLLLTFTTRHFYLLKILRGLGVGKVFVMVLGMCYRYVYLFIEIIQSTYLAIKSRVGYVSSSANGRHIVAWNAASLWHRSYDLHNDVYKAMLSRGYDGEPKILDEFHATLKDVFCFCAAILLFIGVIWRTYFSS